MCDFSINCIHTYIHACLHAHVSIDRFFSQRYVYMQWINININIYIYIIIYIYIYIHVCVLCHFDAFSNSWIHIQEVEVLSVRFPKEYDHIKLAAKHPKLCTYFIQNSVCLWLFNPYPYIHPYIHPHIHAHLLIIWFFQRYVYITCIYICICVSCVFEVYWIYIQEAEVLSVRFPKGYGHINLAAKWSIPSCVHISFKTMFICDFLIHCIHTYIHAYMHIYWLIALFPKICIYHAYIYIHLCVVCYFDVF